VFTPAGLQPNPSHGSHTAYLFMTGAQVMLLPAAGSIIQNGAPPAQLQANGSLTASFHVDVPLSALGVGTNPFTIGIFSSIPGITNGGPTRRK
jgi:hypothetical protein